MCGGLRVGKTNLHVAGLVGAAMCSALGAVRMTAGHNALRESGPDQQQAFSEPVGMPQPCQEPTLRDDCCWRKAAVEPGAGRTFSTEIQANLTIAAANKVVHNGGHKTKAGPLTKPYFIGFLGFPETTD